MQYNAEAYTTTVQRGKSLAELYAHAHERQESLLHETAGICLQLIMEERLRQGDGYYQLKQLGLLQPHISAEEYGRALQNAPHTGNRASDIAYTLRHHNATATADTLVAPEELQLFKEEVEHFRREVVAYEEQLALVLAAYRDGWPIDFPPPPVQPLHPWVSALNRLGEGIVQIREMGVKQPLRAEEKLITRYHSTADNAAPLADIVRLTLVPETPALAERLAEELALSYPNHCDEGWKLKSSGYIDRKCLIDQGGFVAEVKIEDAAQQAAYLKSYQVYKTLRPFMDKERHFTEETSLSPDKIQELHLAYNTIMQRFAVLDKRYDAHPEPRPLQDFRTPAHVQERYTELQALHQSIHRVAAEDSPNVWKALYVTQAEQANNVAEAQGKPPVFAPAWIEKMQEQLPLPLLTSFRQEQVKTSLTNCVSAA